MYTLAYTLVSWVYDLKQLGNFHVIVTRRRWQSFTVSAIWMVSFVCSKNVCMYSNELFNSRFLQLLSVFFRCYWCCRLDFCSISLLNKFLLMSKARLNFCIYCFFSVRISIYINFRSSTSAKGLKLNEAHPNGEHMKITFSHC